MLCTHRSSSNWLDRLRSSKGFPTGKDLDLPQFLSLCNTSPSDSDPKLAGNIHPQIPKNDNTESTDKSDGKQAFVAPNRNRTTSKENHYQNEENHNQLNNVLSQLFCMGDNFSSCSKSSIPTRINLQRKKSRKQAKPRNFVPTRSSNVNDGGPTDFQRWIGEVTAIENDGDVEIKETRRDQMMKKSMTEHEVTDKVYGEGEEDNEGISHADDDLSEFSRTEVTVIDTSCPAWKFDKLLYRKDDVWEVRDTKGKAAARDAGRKKRKGGAEVDKIENGGGGGGGGCGCGGEKKKAKLSIGQCSYSSKGVLPLNEGHDQCNEREKSPKKLNNLSQVPKNRFPRKSKNVGSSVILIKNIPISADNETSIAKCSLKSTQRQCNA